LQVLIVFSISNFTSSVDRYKKIRKPDSALTISAIKRKVFSLLLNVVAVCLPDWKWKLVPI